MLRVYVVFVAFSCFFVAAVFLSVTSVRSTVYSATIVKLLLNCWLLLSCCRWLLPNCCWIASELLPTASTGKRKKGESERF